MKKVLALIAFSVATVGSSAYGFFGSCCEDSCTVSYYEVAPTCCETSCDSCC